MIKFLKKAFADMKESTKAQHEVSKADFAAAKAKSKPSGRKPRPWASPRPARP